MTDPHAPNFYCSIRRIGWDTLCVASVHACHWTAYIGHSTTNLEYMSFGGGIQASHELTVNGTILPEDVASALFPILARAFEYQIPPNPRCHKPIELAPNGNILQKKGKP